MIANLTGVSIILEGGSPLDRKRKEIGEIFGMKVLLDPNLHDEVRFVRNGKIIGKINTLFEKVEQFASDPNVNANTDGM